MTVEGLLSLILQELVKIRKALDLPKGTADKTKKVPNLIPVRRWSEFHKVPSQGSINGAMLRRKENGLEACVTWMNGRMYLDEDKFFEWMKTQPKWRGYG